MTKPFVAITMGDPAGIGPEICLKALSSRRVLQECRPVVFGSASVMRGVAVQCELKLRADIISHEEWLDVTSVLSDRCNAVVVDVARIQAEKIQPGKVNKLSGQVAYYCIKAAVDAALARRVVGIATAPINKKALQVAGVPYPGHTEMLAALTGTQKYCMMLTSQKITVSLVTIHVPYTSVPRYIRQQRVLDVILLTADAMRRLGRQRPRLVVCGLNPHAGEDGLFGAEEEAILQAVHAARQKGIDVTGPIPADTAFVPARLARTDAYVAMYHDQGLIPFKMLSFDNGVNVSLGLPIVRTSADHGTAFDIAWQGKASAESLVESVLLAVRLGTPAKQLKRRA